jgi:hypothetical protein
MWPALILCSLSAVPVHDEQDVLGTSKSAASLNFQIYSSHLRCDARRVAERCEQWRTHLHEKWLGDDAPAAWTPRCIVVVHDGRDAYQAAIGGGGSRTYGSSLVDAEDGRVTQRRIDLLLDARGSVSALGHELTHVVLADAFGGGSPPLWANEGIAILADVAEKQRLHRRDLAHSLQRQTAFHCAELTQLAAYPPAERIPAFYGQSAALVELLARRGGPQSVVPFLRRAAEAGYDQALRESYGLAGLTALQRSWLHGSGELALP